MGKDRRLVILLPVLCRCARGRPGRVCGQAPDAFFSAVGGCDRTDALDACHELHLCNQSRTLPGRLFSFFFFPRACELVNLQINYLQCREISFKPALSGWIR